MRLTGQKTKIVCTIGPASRSVEVLKGMIRAGMNVARLNLAHGNLEEHEKDIQLIRSVAIKSGRVVTILIDLPGPKIRVGRLENEPIALKKDDIVILTTLDVPGSGALIPVDYKDLPLSVSRGSLIYLNDGFLQLRVQRVSDIEVRCKVIVGGPLLSHKGVNLPKARLTLDAVTDRDLDIVDFGMRHGVDTYSISFVEKADDIVRVKEFAENRGRSIYTVAKIERAEAVKNIDQILDVSDAIMIARGDLGVQTPIEEIPVVQKRLIRKANLLGRPVITATHMLESMTDNIRPTRAEVTDVANAILDGTDAVMLSGETAVGNYPLETVKIMARIAMTIERQRRSIRLSSDLEDWFKRGPGRKNVGVDDVVSLNVIEAGRLLKTRFIVTPTETGGTPRRVSRFKPDCWVLAFSRHEPAQRFLALSYGVWPFLITEGFDSWHDAIINFLEKHSLAEKGDRLVLTQGSPAGGPGGTDSFRIFNV